jgi:PAS domain S-box-containing protein
MFFDYTEEEMLGRNVVGTIVPETWSSGLDPVFMIKDIGINPEKYTTNENENMRRNGERVWIAWANKAIRDGNGKVIEILCIGTGNLIIGV